jgi:hypothetical protein
MNETGESLWASVTRLLNDGSEDQDGDRLYECVVDLIERLEGGAALPANLVVKPGLTKEGFLNLLRVLKAGLD